VRPCRPRRDRRQHELLAREERFPQHLALDLEPDEKEEDRHQPVIDPQQRRLAETVAADRD
jgi:hypothetical protein